MPDDSKVVQSLKGFHPYVEHRLLHFFLAQIFLQGKKTFTFLDCPNSGELNFVPAHSSHLHKWAGKTRAALELRMNRVIEVANTGVITVVLHFFFVGAGNMMQLLKLGGQRERKAAHSVYDKASKAQKSRTIT